MEPQRTAPCGPMRFGLATTTGPLSLFSPFINAHNQARGRCQAGVAHCVIELDRGAIKRMVQIDWCYVIYYVIDSKQQDIHIYFSSRMCIYIYVYIYTRILGPPKAGQENKAENADSNKCLKFENMNCWTSWIVECVYLVFLRMDRHI